MKKIFNIINQFVAKLVLFQFCPEYNDNIGIDNIIIRLIENPPIRIYTSKYDNNIIIETSMYIFSACNHNKYNGWLNNGILVNKKTYRHRSWMDEIPTAYGMLLLQVYINKHQNFINIDNEVLDNEVLDNMAYA